MNRRNFVQAAGLGGLLACVSGKTLDYADLDGNLLVANDPYRGVTVKDGQLILPNRPGLGLLSA